MKVSSDNLQLSVSDLVASIDYDHTQYDLVVNISPRELDCSKVGTQNIRFTARLTQPSPKNIAFMTSRFMLVKPNGDIMLADNRNGQIRYLDHNGEVTTPHKSLPGPNGMFFDAAGNLFIAESTGSQIDKVAPGGQLNPFIPMTAQLYDIYGMAADRAGNIYLTKPGRNQIYKISPGGAISLLAGAEDYSDGLVDGQGSAARFRNPQGIITDNDGNILVADTDNGKIRKISPKGRVTTLTLDGLRKPTGLYLDRSGSLYVTDTGNPSVTKYAPDGTATPLAGPSDGLSTPTAVGLDADGNVYILDGRVIYKIDTKGYIKAYAGGGGGTNNTDGNIAPIIGPEFVADIPVKVISQITFSATPADQQLQANGPCPPVNLPDYRSLVTATDQCGRPVTFRQWPSPDTAITSNELLLVRIFASDGLGSVDSVRFHVKVTIPDQSTASAALTVTGNNSCPQTPVHLTVVPSANILNPAIRWIRNLSPITGETNKDLTYNNFIDGDSVRAELTFNDPGCTEIRTIRSEKITIRRQRQPMPAVKIQAPSGLTCAGDPIRLTAETTEAGDQPFIQWLVNGAPAGTGQEFTLPNPADQTQISCSLRSNAPCAAPATVFSDIYTVRLTPKVNSAISLSALNQPACEGETITFRAELSVPVPNATYTWKVNNKIVDANTAMYSTHTLQSGDEVTCSLSSPAACVTPANSLPYAVMINPLAKAIYPQTIVLLGKMRVQLKPEQLVGNIASYNWTYSPSLSALNIPDPFAFPETTTTYYLTVTSDNSCTFQTSVTIYLLTNETVFNTFTPNGDGINDLWVLPPLPNFPNANLKIFNRLGQLVHQSTGSRLSWDGRLNGRELPAGPYYYIVDLRDGKHIASGPLTIIR